MSAHKIIIVTKEAKRLAVIDVIFANKVSWVKECKSVASQWCKDNNKQLDSYFPAMGNLTVWVDQMNTIEQNNTVRILSEDKNSINSHARVETVTEDGVWVTNTNMPFQGTYSYKFFTFDQVSK